MAGLPHDLARYSLPVRRSGASGRTLAVFSVDWEKDHGPWRHPSRSVDLGGVLTATPALCSVLDELELPCTWFVECNPGRPERDMPSAAPQAFAQLAARPRDELGLHLHWPECSPEDGSLAFLYQEKAVRRVLEASARHLEGLAARPVRSFRSGGHLAVHNLPRVLAGLGVVFDGSVEDRRPGWLRRVHTWMGMGVDAYRPGDSPLRPGGAPLLEVPTNLHLHGFEQLMRVWKRYLPIGRQRVFSFYIHIDELTVAASAPDGEAELDPARVQGLKRLLTSWKGCPGLEWVTASRAAERILADG